MKFNQEKLIGAVYMYIYTGSASQISFEESIVGESRAEKMRQRSVVRRKKLPQIIHDNIPVQQIKNNKIRESN